MAGGAHTAVRPPPHLSPELSVWQLRDPDPLTALSPPPAPAPRTLYERDHSRSLL